MFVVTTERIHVTTDGGRGDSVAVFIDLDTVLLDTHQGKYGPELTVQADLPVSLERLAEAAGRVVVVANPPPNDGGHVMDTDHRLEVLRSGLGDATDDLVIVRCSHGEDDHCDCAKPGNGLIEAAVAEHRLNRHGSWYVGGDQEGVVAGRSAGLHTIRIGPGGVGPGGAGPGGEDHLNAVHRADFLARDLMDAANRILMESLTAD